MDCWATAKVLGAQPRFLRLAGFNMIIDSTLYKPPSTTISSQLCVKSGGRGRRQFISNGHVKIDVCNELFLLLY